MLLGTDLVGALTTLQYFAGEHHRVNFRPDLAHARASGVLESTAQQVGIVHPERGVAINVGGQAVYPLEAEPMAKALYEFVTEFGISVVGGCCGTGPEHIAAIVEALGHDRPSSQRPTYFVPRISSGMRGNFLQQEPAPTIVGERINSKVRGKRLLLSQLMYFEVGGQVEGGGTFLTCSGSPSGDEETRS